MNPLHGAIEDDVHSSMQIAALVYEHDPGLGPPGASLPENGKELMRPADSLENGLSAGRAHVAKFLGTAEQSQTLKVCLPFEGHCGPSQVAVW